MLSKKPFPDNLIDEKLPQRSVYRPEIDGLRGIAVLAVITYHFGISYVSGGYVGVSIFFVISGYVITNSILVYKSFGRRFLAQFFESRLKRIIPGLFFLLTILSIYGLYAPPFFSRDLFQSTFASALFLENILLIIESSNYFAIDAAEKVLSHTWTLGVEAQLYLFFPFLFILIARERVVLILVMILFLSFFLNYIVSDNFPNLGFYLFLTRAWEFCAGAILIFCRDKFYKQQQGTFAFLGLALLSIAIMGLSPLPAEAAFVNIIVVFATCLIILFSNENTLSNKILSFPAIRYVGILSYSLYLWHQPLIVIVEKELCGFLLLCEYNSVGFFIISSLLIFSVSIFSFYFVEKPFRKGSVRDTKLLLITTVALVVLVIISFSGHFTRGFENAKVQWLGKNKIDYVSHFELLNDKRKITAELRTNVASNGEILFIGDSLADDGQLSLLAVGVPADIISIDGECFSSLLAGDESCGWLLNNLIKEVSKYRKVVISTDYSQEDSLLETLFLADLLMNYSEVFIVSHFRLKSHYSDWSFVSDRARKMGNKPRSVSHFNIVDSSALNGRLELLKLSESILVIDKIGIFCEINAGNGDCHLMDHQTGNAYFFDKQHLTRDGLIFFGRKMKEFLK